MHDPHDHERRALALFREVVDLPEAERQARLDGEAPAVVERVRALIVADAEEAVLDRPVVEGAAMLLAADLADEHVPLEAQPLPERIGPWRITGLLGAGGMGVVYEAEQEHPRRRIALKVLRPELRRRQGARFRAEADALAAVVHPGVPQVYEAGLDDGVPWMAMERVDGVALDRWAEAAAPLERLAVLIAVCEAVGFAHDRGLVHRDLKPGNILVTPEGQPKVMDFGLAVTGSGEEEVAAAGTRGWMAPEAERGELDALAPTADVFSLGRLGEVLLHDLPWPVREDLPWVLRRATAPDPADRYPTAAPLAEDLRRLRDSWPVAARPTSPWLALRRFSWRHRVAGRTLGLALLVGLVGVALVLIVQQWRAVAREAEAAARLQALAPVVAELVARREHDEAHALLEAATSGPGVARTRAAASAWLDLAGHLRQAGDRPRARQAVGEAFLAGGASVPTLRTIAELHAANRDAAALGVTLARLEELGGATPELRALHRALVRDPAGAAAADPSAPGAPVLQALAAVTPTPWQAWGAWPVQVAGAERVLLAHQAGDALVLAETGADLAEWASGPLPEGLVWGSNLPRPVPGSAWWWGRQADDRLVLLDPTCSTAGALCTERVRVTERPWTGAAAVADGETVLLGLGPYDRTLLAWDAEGVRVAAADLDAAASDVVELMLLDTDGDGEEELVAAVGPWRAFDVRILERDGARWTTRARHQLGNVDSMVAVPGPDRPRLLAAKTAYYPAPEVFGPEEPLGDPEGVYVFEDRDGALVEVAYLPVPVGDLFPGDFDGDGLQDVAIQHDRAPELAVVLRGRADGGFDPVRLSGVLPIGVAQLDDDPADELIVRMPDRDQQTWVLGAGEARLPPPPLTRVDVPALGLSSEVGQRVMDLARSGLPEDAARLALRLAVAEPPPVAARLQAWAGRVLVQRGSVEDGAEALDAAATSGLGPDVLREAAEAWRSAHAPRREEAVLERLVALDADPAARTRLDAVRPRAAGLSWTEGEPLPPGWRLDHPTGVRTSPPGTLRLDVVGDLPPVLSHPVEATGDFLAVEAEVDLQRAEFGGGVTLGFYDGELLLARIALGVGGGGGAMQVGARCEGPAAGGTWSTELGEARPWAAVGRYRVRLSLDAGLREVRCTVRDPDDGTVLGRMGGLTPAGVPRPTRVAVGPETFVSARAQVRVLALQVEGVEPLPALPAPARRSLAQGDARGAADLLDDPVLEAVVALRTGRPGAVAARLADVSVEGPLPPDLLLALRQDPAVAVPALLPWRGAALGADLLHQLQATWDAPYPEALPLLTHPVLDRAPLVSPRDREAWVHRTTALLELDALDAAEGSARRILDDPSLEQDLRARVLVVLARIAERRGRPDEAARWWRRAEAHSPDEALLGLR